MLVPPFAAFAPVFDRTLGLRVEYVRAGAHAAEVPFGTHSAPGICHPRGLVDR